MIKAVAGGRGTVENGMSEAIIQPRRGKRSPRLGAVAVLAATEPDLRRLRDRLGFGSDEGRRLHNSRLYTLSESFPDVCLAGPMVGAPYAVMAAETLIGWGARALVFLGWCGAVARSVAIGDLVLPTSSLVDEGTSRHYVPGGSESTASPSLVQKLSEACTAQSLVVHRGAVWTTDAPFRETREKVLAFRRQGALAVEMECSALFTLGAFRSVELAALLVASDDLSTLTWIPGFKDPRFACGREAACSAIGKVCAMMSVT